MTRAKKIALAIAATLLVLTIAGSVLAAVLLAPLDREVVIHWGITAEPDGWGPAWTYPVLIGVLGLVLSAIALGFALIPTRAPAEVVDPEPIHLAPGEIAGWSRTVMASPAFYWVVISGIVVAAAGAALAIWATSGRAWPAVFIPVLLVIALAVTAGWRVSAGPSGLTVRGIFGLPVFRVRSADIAGVVAVGIHPMRDFSGWGIRGSLGPDGHLRTGIIVRAGDAIQVTRRNGKQLVVTVDDAATAAAVLKAYATP